MRHFAIALLLTACVDEHHGSGTLGSPSDVTTIPGDYTGYRIVMPCGNTWSDVGVIGTGSIAVTAGDAISSAGHDLKSRLVDVASIWGWGGYALACEPGIGAPIDLYDWRDVDTVIARTGAWLVEHDYALQVSISVGGQPVPQAN
jgi:hypothetical protein